MNPKNIEKLYQMPLARVYPLWVAKVVKKGRTQVELDQVIQWLTGYTPEKVTAAVANSITVGDFFTNMPKLNPGSHLITGVICGVRVENITEHPIQEIRYLDKLVDELAKGRPMEKILRKETT
jgi:hypothetical protein